MKATYEGRGKVMIKWKDHREKEREIEVPERRNTSRFARLKEALHSAVSLQNKKKKIITYNLN